MTAIVSVLIAAAFLVCTGAGIFLAIVISIHKVDRSKSLNESPRSCLDAATRHVLGARECASSRRRHEEH